MKITRKGARAVPRWRHLCFLCAVILIFACVKTRVDMSQRVQAPGRGCCQGPGLKPARPAPTMLLELDSIWQAEVITEKESGLTLEDSLCMGTYPDGCDGLAVEVTRAEAITIEDIEEDCIGEGSLDQLIGCSRDQWPLPGQWYAHGIASPFQVRYNDNDTCSDASGVLWPSRAACDLPGKEYEGHEAGIRQDFVVFDRGLLGQDGLMASTVHELGHVLNLHHEDFREEGSRYTGELGWVAKAHLGAKTSDVNSAAYLHLAPGPSPSWPHCAYPAEHDNLHSYNCCGGSSLAFVTSASSASLASMLIRLEKPRYCPGEPLTVKMVLMANSDLDYYDKFDPSYGFSTVWAADAGQPFRRLPTPKYIDANLPLTALAVNARSVSRFDVWFGTGINQDQSSQLVVSFTGFDPPGQSVVSPAATVHIVDSGLCDPAARALFLTPQARRFVWLRGGDHLQAGRIALETISANHAESVYAPYANLALGLHWARPFYGVNAAGKIVRRAPDPVRAQDHLRKANDRRGHLPRSYRILLNRWLDRDGDLISNIMDNCPTIFNPGQADTSIPANGVGDACDGVLDREPFYAVVIKAGPNGVIDSVIPPLSDDVLLPGSPVIWAGPDGQAGTLPAGDDILLLTIDLLGIGEGQDCDPTAPGNNGDGVPDAVDNCPGVCNFDQSDADGDGIGDACELP